MGFFSSVGSAITGGITSGISGGIESAIGAGVGSALGGAQGSVGIERTVRKAKRAGIHPLFALGYGGGYPEGGAQIMKGQASTGIDTKNAMAAAQIEATKAQTEMWNAEAELARSKAMQLMQKPQVDLQDLRVPGALPKTISNLRPRRNPARHAYKDEGYGRFVMIDGKRVRVGKGYSPAEVMTYELGEVAPELILAPMNLQETVTAPQEWRPRRKPSYNVPPDAWGVY